MVNEDRAELVQRLVIVIRALEECYEKRDQQALRSRTDEMLACAEALEILMNNERVHVTGSAQAGAWLVRVTAESLREVAFSSVISWERVGGLLSFAESGVQRVLGGGTDRT